MPGVASYSPEEPDTYPKGPMETWEFRQAHGSRRILGGLPRSTPTEIAHWVARRTGVDFVNPDSFDAQSRQVKVSTAIRCRDALLPSSYDAHAHEGLRGTVELVLIDPPFGKDKHKGDGGGDWDTLENKWAPSPAILEVIHPDLLHPEHYCVAVYCQYQDIEDWRRALDKKVEKKLQPKGSLLIVLSRDGPSKLRKGAESPGTRTFLLVMKYGNGAAAVKSEMSRNAGRFTFSFPPPQVHSRYGRLDIDGELMDGKSKVNATQKGVEETRLLIRQLAPEGGSVLSVCNGTGTALVAAAMEGRNALGIDNDEYQCRWARRRMRAFEAREAYTVRALAEGLHVDSDARKALREAANEDRLPDVLVGAAATQLRMLYILSLHGDRLHM